MYNWKFQEFMRKSRFIDIINLLYSIFPIKIHAKRLQKVTEKT